MPVTVSTYTGATTDEAIARYDGVAGATQNSLVTITDAGVVSGATQLNVENLRLDLNTISSTNAGGDILLDCNTTGVVEIASNATKAGTLRFREPVGSGTNSITFQAPAMAGDTAYLWPNAYPAVSGYVLSSDTSGTTSWVSNGAASWVDQTSTPVSIVAGRSYSANNAGLVTLNMPATAAFGDVFEVAGQGAGGWLLQAAGGQTINLGSSPTSVAGSLASTNRYDAVKLVCTVANTTFNVVSVIGNLTVA